ncbi:MAG: phosphopyruvate hydratase [Pelagibacteraceae bacterium]|jgi:enolase|nr:phosphopyruvate hydratase [Candidatus Pelagibacter sp.]MDP6681309.1 phosphopyruvate hydratase [Pelagibacteraceae bacterium]MDP6709814.1 phosphopyruvate hydratase [Pelagibacteraceae bacterium]|tara:strand:+ start:365 stop:1633 length:1269 start_codon:yes stop_codon:yes gene_type:complete
MSKINKIKGRQVFDSRGNPTVEAEVFLEDGNRASAIVPSGASTGTHEAFELRDQDNKNYLGKSVLAAVENINRSISKSLNDFDIFDQRKIDKTLIDLDGTRQKNKLGANSILAVSLAVSKLAAICKNISLFKYLGGTVANQLPIPLMNIINGGAHANNSLRIQEFIIRPEKPETFSEAVRICFLVIQNLKILINNKNISTTVGDEGGFAPELNKNEEAIELILESIENSGFKPGEDVSICLDVASNELYKDGKYSVQSSKFEKMKNTINYYSKLIDSYPIKSIEDPFAEDDWVAWGEFMKFLKKNNKKTQIVGDDLFVTNKERLNKGIKEKMANAILIKPNQIGTLTETMEVIDLAHKGGFKTIISHRSGDSEDTFIADLAVATNSSQIKSGSLVRSERVAKYNRLLRIEEELGNSAKMAKV